MGTPLEKYVEATGPDKSMKVPTDACDAEHGRYHNPVCDVAQPLRPSVNTKKPFSSMEGK